LNVSQSGAISGIFSTSYPVENIFLNSPEINIAKSHFAMEIHREKPENFHKKVLYRVWIFLSRF
jgi:hypothetical protein